MAIVHRYPPPFWRPFPSIDDEDEDDEDDDGDGDEIYLDVLSWKAG